MNKSSCYGLGALIVFGGLIAYEKFDHETTPLLAEENFQQTTEVDLTPEVPQEEPEPENSQQDAEDAGDTANGSDSCPCVDCPCDPCECGVSYELWTATWCGPCKKIEQQVGEDWYAANSIDVDQNQEVAESLGIQALPVLIVKRFGREEARYDDLQSILLELRKAGLIVKKSTPTDSASSKSTGKSSTNSTSCPNGNCGTTSRKKSRKSTKTRRTRPGLFGRWRR